MKAIQTFDERYVHLLIWISVSSYELQYLSSWRFSGKDSLEIRLQAVEGSIGPRINRAK